MHVWLGLELHISLNSEVRVSEDSHKNHKKIGLLLISTFFVKPSEALLDKHLKLFSSFHVNVCQFGLLANQFVKDKAQAKINKSMTSRNEKLGIFFFLHTTQQPLLCRNCFTLQSLNLALSWHVQVAANMWTR